MHGENDLAAAFVRRTENIGIRGLEQGVRQAEFPERLLGHRQVSLAPGLHTVHPQGIVGLQHRHGGRRGHGLVRRIGDVPFRVGNVAFHAHQHFRDGGASEEQLRVGRFVAPERQRGIAPDACDLEEAVRADEVGVPQTEGPRFLLQPHRRDMPDDQVCLVDRRVERRPVGILVDRAHGAGAHLRLVDAVERVVRPRAPQPVAQLAPAEVDVVHALERAAQVDVQPVGGRRGVALLFPHVAGRELVVLHDVQVAVTAARPVCAEQQRDSGYSLSEFRFHGSRVSEREFGREEHFARRRVGTEPGVVGRRRGVEAAGGRRLEHSGVILAHCNLPAGPSSSRACCPRR